MATRPLLIHTTPLWGLLLLLVLAGGAAAFLPSKPFSVCSSTTARPIPQQQTASSPLLLPRFTFSVNQNDDNEEEEEENEDEDEDEHPSSPSSLRRRRDRIRDWISSGRSSGASSPMVRPIRMEDGSIVEDDDNNNTPEPSRLKANFGDLFSGMPSMDDILKSGSSSISDDKDDNNTQQQQSLKQQSKKPKPDESWFEQERKEIEANYQDILKTMTSQLDEQRRQDPDGVPSNAEAMIKDVLRQEMKTEIAQAKEEAAKERLSEYQKTQQESFDAQDLEGVTNDVVDKLMEQDQKLQEQRDAEQSRIDDYRRYELEAFLRKPNQDNNDNNSGVNMPKANSDLDQWALESLQAMAEKSQNGEKDEEFMVTDLVEERMEDLRERIEKEAARSTIKPETMKEWQMYRAIAFRLGIVADAKNPTAMQGDEETEKLIASQLQSWKDYNAKEEIYRKDSGLARGPKLPFEWQESGLDREREDAQTQAALQTRGEMTKVEIRKEVNRKSIEALEQLVATSDPIRSERLKKDLELLKESLESNDYLDVDESYLEEQEEVLGPVDLSDFFASSRKDETSQSPQERFRAERNEISSRSATPNQSYSYGGSNADNNNEPSASSPDIPVSNYRSDQERKPPPPNTPFFSQSDEDTDTDALDEDVAQPPDTPFFSSQEDDTSEEPQGSGYRLGTIEEQKLRNMYQKAGARTDEQKAVIRKQWEEFQQFEKTSRDQSGLGEGDGSEWLSQASLKYNISDVTKDGDIDAEKILASLGPRPKRKPRNDVGTASGDQKPDQQDSGDDSNLDSKLDPAEVSDSLYRAVSAVGGGRTRDDPEAKAKEKAAFSEYMNRENELRNSLDDIDEEVQSEVTNYDGTFDDEEYAEDALASLGPRPAKRRRISESEYSDQGIALSDDKDEETEDEDEDVDGDDGDTVQAQDMAQDETPDDSMPSTDGPVPGWLRKERATARNRGGGGGIAESFLGSDIDDVFEDDTYEHNMRQLAEYERRRQGGKKQMGIDISDVLGRTSDDYADYNFDDNYFRGKTSGFGLDGFEARKANLLEYTELDLLEVKSLMDHKDSVHATGVSQYLPRINKPFKEFGAIFRLEGVLMDTTGFQFESWKRVAAEMNFKAPVLEDVRRASVMRPEVAVREAFFWTDDIILCRETASAHQKALGDVFDEWVKKSGVAPPSAANAEESSGSQGGLVIGEEVISSTPAKPVMDPLLAGSEDERIKVLHDVWSRTAVVHRLAAPSREQIEMASVLSPDIAVKEAFRWTTDPTEVDKYVATYREKLRGFAGADDKKSASEEPRFKGERAKQLEQSTKPRPLDTNSMLEIQFKAWTKLAEDNGFEVPLPEEVMAAVTINDPLISIRDGFGWSDDSSRLPSLVKSYKDNLNSLISEWQGGPPVSSTPSGDSEPDQQGEIVEAPEVAPQSNNPNHEELLEILHYAWQTAALNHGFKVPPQDQLELAMKMVPQESISRLFGWTSDEAVIEKVCATYETALKNISQQYLRKYGLTTDFVLFPYQSAASTEKQSSAAAPKSADVFQAAYGAWTEVAKKKGYRLPDEEEVLFAMTVGPEEAVISGFQWVDRSDFELVSKIVEAYKDELKSYRSDWKSQGIETGSSPKVEATEDEIPMFTVTPGVEKWVTSLMDVEMQCAVISYLTRDQLDTLLEVAGLSHLFGRDKRISANNNYARDVDQLLGAALRLERRPDHCAVFDSSPYASAAAHDVEMRSVSIIGTFPRYELLTADSTAASFDELTAMNVRRLFGERIYDQPLEDAEQTDPQLRRQQKTKTKYRWGDE